MDKHVAWLRVLASVVIVLSVTANLLRPAPLGLPGSFETSSTALSSTPLETALEAPSKKPVCPCPTEIENADCDNGLCKTVVAAGAAAPLAPFPASQRLGPGRDHNGLARKPELTPPKLFA